MKLTNLAKLAALTAGFAVALSALEARSAPSSREPMTLRTLYGLKATTELRSAHTAVVLVDFQNEFVRGRLALPEAPAAIERAVELVRWARGSGPLLVFVQNVVNRANSPLFVAGSEAAAFVPELQPAPTDFVLQKSMMGAFSRTNLDQELRARGIDTLIVAGFMTHLAVLSTTSDATVLGYRVLVASDATATRALPGAGGEKGVDSLLMQRAALAAMADRIADVRRAHEIMTLKITHE